MRTLELYAFQIQEIEKIRKRLSHWDFEFIKAIKRRLSLGYPLTDKQKEILEGMYQRATDPKRLKW